MNKIDQISLINPREYDFTVSLLREFFQERGFIETPVQHRLSILAACEDPSTVATIQYAGQVWPLPQTGQMWLEYELLKDPKANGFYCISTSYRNEPDPIPGRHDLIFPMFEFETHGGISDLLVLENKLLDFLGFSGARPTLIYENVCRDFGIDEITAEYEEILWKKWEVFFLMFFPMRTSPFWNMKKEADCANKIDVILYGMETIGSAERSVDCKEMCEQFHTISNGMYAKMLYSRFTKERVEDELEKFLSLEFFPRCGGGIGVTRMIRALKLAGIL